MAFSNAGPCNPAWKGGHQYWQSGKLGRDKDGLSWKIQRALCRLRDNHTCQDCGRTAADLGQEPDCDHIVPYRLSFSHALSNLILRCRSCHKKAEAKHPQLWGGKSFGGGPRHRAAPKGCGSCGLPGRKLNERGWCSECFRDLVLIPRAARLESLGLSQEAIGRAVGVTQPCIWLWFNRVMRKFN